MNKPLSLTWDLESIFPGGSHSPALDRHLKGAARDIEALNERLKAFVVPQDPSEPGPLAEIVDELQSTTRKLRQASAFVSCLLAQDVNDRQAPIVRARIDRLYADLYKAWTSVDEVVLGIDDDLWSKLLDAPGLRGGKRTP